MAYTTRAPCQPGTSGHLPGTCARKEQHQPARWSDAVWFTPPTTRRQAKQMKASLRWFHLSAGRAGKDCLPSRRGIACKLPGGAPRPLAAPTKVRLYVQRQPSHAYLEGLLEDAPLVEGGPGMSEVPVRAHHHRDNPFATIRLPGRGLSSVSHVRNPRPGVPSTSSTSSPTATLSTVGNRKVWCCTDIQCPVRPQSHITARLRLTVSMRAQHKPGVFPLRPVEIQFASHTTSASAVFLPQGTSHPHRFPTPFREPLPPLRHAFRNRAFGHRSIVPAPPSFDAPRRHLACRPYAPPRSPSPHLAGLASTRARPRLSWRLAGLRRPERTWAMARP
jgi:hypothetical protein